MSLDELNMFRAGNDNSFTTELLRSGIPPLDYCLGGGFAYGKFTEIFGDFATGKTVLTHMALAANQKLGGESILAETEQSFDKDFFCALGGDAEKLKMLDYKHTATVEDIFMAVRKICEQILKDQKDSEIYKRTVIAWDSIALASTKHLEDTGLDKLDMTKAKVLKAGAQYVTQYLARAKVAFIATNQVYELINQTTSRGYTPVTSSGGKGMKFLATHRIELRFDGGEKGSSIVTKIGDREIQVGRKILASVVKNKIASPWGSCSLPFYTENGYPHPIYDKETKIGFDIDEALFDFYLEGNYKFLGTQQRVVKQTGGWYCLNPAIETEQKKWRKSEWPQKLEEHPFLRELLYDEGDSRAIEEPIADSAPELQSAESTGNV